MKRSPNVVASLTVLIRQWNSRRKILEQYVTSIGEVPRTNVVSHVEPRLFDAKKNTSPTVVFKRMLTASLNFSGKIGAVCVLGREYVVCPERATLSFIITHEGLGSRLVVCSARSALRSFDEDVLTTVERAGHAENIEGSFALIVVTGAS